MVGLEQVHVEEVKDSNKKWVDYSEKGISDNAEKVENANREWVDLGFQTPEEAKKKSDWIVENSESKKDIQMLNEIIKAFNDDEGWKLTNLREKYDSLTTKIMASYNSEIKKVLENSNNGENREGMENKDSRESSSAESEEKSWDFSEFNIMNINENPELAKRLSDDVMKPQPKEVLGQISDINEVLEKWSGENKKILEETISNVQADISNLYYAAWLDKKEN